MLTQPAMIKAHVAHPQNVVSIPVLKQVKRKLFETKRKHCPLACGFQCLQLSSSVDYDVPESRCADRDRESVSTVSRTAISFEPLLLTSFEARRFSTLIIML